MESFFAELTLADALAYIQNFVFGLVVLVVAWFVAGWSRKLVRRALDRPRLDTTLMKFVGNLLYYAIFVLGILAALSTMGVEVASFVAILAAAGFAVGLALQGTLANFAAGVMLLIFRPFRVDDYITIADETGFVREIQLFYTIIDQRDNQRIIVPNSDVFGSTIRNQFHHDAVRVDVGVGTDYPADIDEVLLEAAASVDDRIEAKGEQAALKGLGDSAIIWEVRIWCEPANYFRLKQELTRSVKYALDAADIGIPYPQMDIHMDKLNGEVAEPAADA